MLNSLIPWAGLLWPLPNPSRPYPVAAKDPVVVLHAVENAAMQHDDSVPPSASRSARAVRPAAKLR